MEKKSIIFLLLELIAIFLWLFFIGQANGISALFGDINMIDEGQFAAWVNHMYHGKIVYRDFYLQYGPFFVFPAFYVSRLIGQTMFAIRLTSIVGVFLGISVALFTLRYLKIPRVMYIVSMFFLILIPGIHIRHFISILCFIICIEASRRKSLFLAFTCGVLTAFSLLQSIEVGIFSLFTTTVYMAIKVVTGKNLVSNLKIVFAIFFGLILFLLIFMQFASKGEWLDSYIQTTIEFSNSISGVNLPNGQGLPGISLSSLFNHGLIYFIKFLVSKEMLFYISLLILLLSESLLIIRFFIKKTTKRDDLIAMIICFSLLTYFSIVGRSGHYFVVVPFIFICFAYFFSLLRLSQKNSRNIGMLFFMCFLLYGIRHLLIFKYSLLTNLQAHKYVNNSVRKVQPLSISQTQAYDIIKLQDFINKNTQETDQIFIFNNLPALYFLLNRENATRYDLPLLANSQDKRFEIVSSLINNPPKFIIKNKKAWAVDEVNDEDRLPEIVDFIKQNYHQSNTIESFVIFSKNK